MQGRRIRSEVSISVSGIPGQERSAVWVFHVFCHYCESKFRHWANEWAHRECTTLS